MKEIYVCSYCGRISTIRQSFDVRKSIDKKIHLFCDEDCDISYLAERLKQETNNNSSPKD